MSGLLDDSAKVATARTPSSAGSLFTRILTRKDRNVTIKHADDKPKGPLGLSTLYDPENPAIADLVFVHGLNGGSKSTWTKDNDASLFWPKQWLPQDDAFRDVRIHSYGYASQISNESVLNIHDFSSNLLSSLHHSPSVSSAKSTPIIFVAHSMGGLVVKKAYILSHQIAEYASISARVVAMFFLATPHHGAGIAQLLSRLLSTTGPRPFVNDLTPQSGMLQSINEEFPRFCQHLHLLSFCETLPMYYGVGKGLIVEKHFSVLNYANETRAYLDANHRDVARFSSPRDPSYMLVRNALATTINSHRSSLESTKQEARQENERIISRFLAVSAPPEDELMMLDSLRQPDTCEWLINKDSFQRWRDSTVSKTFWLRGRPGAGKSILASHVVYHLRTLELDCSYYFFNNRDKEKATINSLLRSIAWQMAALHPEILEQLTGIAETWKGSSIDKVDHSPVWRSIFAVGILKVKLNRLQYWVIDSIDECKNSPELMTFLAKIQEVWPLCILVTSRGPGNSLITRTTHRSEIISETILTENRNDIASFLNANIHQIPGSTTGAKQETAATILHNSQGCFLWVALVLNELRKMHGSAEVDRVLNSNPADMDSLYSNILVEMSGATYGKELMEAILTWATYGLRPFTTAEFKHAIEKDINDSIDDIAKCISDRCGNLVYVDSSSKVQLVHVTARDFLICSNNHFDFLLGKTEGCRRLTIVCLRVLSGGLDATRANTRRSSKVRRPASDLHQGQQDPLCEYASMYVFQHINQVSSSDNEIFVELAGFFTSKHVLTWIERLAASSDLQRIYQAGKICKSLLDRRATHSPATGLQKELSIIGKWSNDLVRLVNKFGRQLIEFPSSIHHLIPPFCPSESAIREQFAHPLRGLSVQGCSSNTWHDCLSVTSFPRTAKPLDIATSEKYFAVSLSNGNVAIYANPTLQEVQRFEHREAVGAMALGESCDLLATGGTRTVRIWSLLSMSEIASFSVTAACMSIMFTNDDKLLILATKSSQIVFWNVQDSSPTEEPIFWARDFETNAPQLSHKRATIAAFGLEQGLLGIAYRGEELILWSLEEDKLYDFYEKQKGSRNGVYQPSNGSTTVWAMAFTSTDDSNLLIVAYSDGDTFVYDTETGRPRGSLIGINAQTISCSPDGRTLATADSQGDIRLFDLQSLKFIYRLHLDSEAIRIKTLAFTFDSLHILDIRGNQLRVWDPTVLLRQEMDDEMNSDTVSISTSPQETSYEVEDSIEITAMTCTRNLFAVFCGKEDGSVHVYETENELLSQELFVQKANCAITYLYFDEDSGILAIADAASHVTCRRLKRRKKMAWEASEPFFDHSFEVTVIQLSCHGNLNRLLVSLSGTDILWDISPNTGSRRVADLSGNSHTRWMSSSMSPELLIRIDESSGALHSWGDLSVVQTIRLELSRTSTLFVERVIPFHNPQYFATKGRISSDGSNTEPSLLIWDVRDFCSFTTHSGQQKPSQPTIVSPTLDMTKLNINIADIEKVIGVVNSRVVFFNSTNWICSADMDSSLDKTAMSSVGESSVSSDDSVRHLFIPDDWVSLVNRILIDVRRSGEVIFIKRSELAVIRRGLEVTGKGTFNAHRSALRPILSRPRGGRHESI